MYYQPAYALYFVVNRKDLDLQLRPLLILAQESLVVNVGKANVQDESFVVGNSPPVPHATPARPDWTAVGDTLNEDPKNALVGGVVGHHRQ